MEFGSATFGSDGFSSSGTGKLVALLGDSSDHNGHLINTNQDNTLVVEGVPVCVAGCMHYCPIVGHGTQPVTPVTIKSYHNGKLIITYGAMAAAPCNAVIQPPDRHVYVE